MTCLLQVSKWNPCWKIYLVRNVRKMVDLAYRSLISFAIVKKACSTFKAVFAEVSRKGILSWSANSCIESQTIRVRARQQWRADRRDAVLDDLLACQVRLVSHQQLVNTLRGIAINFLKPLLDIRKGILTTK